MTSVLRYMTISALLGCVAFDATAQPSGALSIPEECHRTDVIDCGRLNAGEIKVLTHFGYCATLTNHSQRDVFIPMRTAAEMLAFIDKAGAVDVAIEPCYPPGHGAVR